MNDRADLWDRRTFLRGAVLTGAVGLVGLQPERALAEPPPETTTLTLVQRAVVCFAPQYVAEPLLQSEGFTTVRWVKKASGLDNYKALASGEADVSFAFCAPVIVRIDAGDPVVFLAGGHRGCQELFGTERVRSIHDLKGKRIAISGPGDGNQAQLAGMIAYIGLDPRKDVEWVSHGGAEPESIRFFVEGKVDACILSPPFGQELRAKKIGHVVVNTSLDRPWSQYFCCMVVTNREFVRTRPSATKRLLRALLKAADLCAAEPDRVAQSLVDKGFTSQLEYAAQAMREVPYGQWRKYNPEDGVRFYALRLKEAGMIKSGPNQIIAQGTDWRFLNELKKELKG